MTTTKLQCAALSKKKNSNLPKEKHQTFHHRDKSSLQQKTFQNQKKNKPSSQKEQLGQ